LTTDARDWPDIIRRWDTEKDFVSYWNDGNYTAAESTVDDYWNDDGYYYFIVKTEGSQGFYTTSDGGDVYDWFSSQTNNLNNCGTWCMGGWKRKPSYHAFPVSKQIIKSAWTSSEPVPQVLIWANKGDKSNEEICNEVYYDVPTQTSTEKVDCHIFDIPNGLQSTENNQQGHANLDPGEGLGDLPGYTACADDGSQHFLEFDVLHTWNQFPPNWGTTNESLWGMDDGADNYHIAFSVTIWPPPYVHSAGVDWELQPFGN
jgi:hypothetical protein